MFVWRYFSVFLEFCVNELLMSWFKLPPAPFLMAGYFFLVTLVLK